MRSALRQLDRFRRISLACALLLAASASGVGTAAAQEPIEGYMAWIGPQDLVNSRGQRLNSAAQVIRQDRANFHHFGRRDPGDEWEPFFATPENRDWLERALTGRIPGWMAQEILRGGVFVEVTVWGRGGRAQAVTVDIPEPCGC